MKQRFILLIWGIACLGLLLSSCTGQSVTEPEKTIPEPSESSAITPSADAIVSLNLLKTEPETGPVGTGFTISGEELPPGKTVEFMWVTWDGKYATDTGPENVVFLERQFDERRVSLGSVTVDAEGKISVSFVAPEDYGETHDIYGVIDGEDNILLNPVCYLCQPAVGKQELLIFSGPECLLHFPVIITAKHIGIDIQTDILSVFVAGFVDDSVFGCRY